MLVLARKKGESIIIGEEIEVRIIAIEGDTIKLGIEAPQHISIYRQEIYAAIQEENRAASQLQVDLGQLKQLGKR